MDMLLIDFGTIQSPMAQKKMIQHLDRLYLDLRPMLLEILSTLLVVLGVGDGLKLDTDWPPTWIAHSCSPSKEVAKGEYDLGILVMFSTWLESSPTWASVLRVITKPKVML